MKFIDINREFTAAANSYMAQGYYINAGTMGGSQGEVAHIDLTNGTEIIRVLLTTFNNYLGTEGVELIVGRVKDDIKPNQEDRWNTVWNERLELVQLPDKLDEAHEMDATNWFLNHHYLKSYNSPYDCTGQEFTNWFYLFRRRGHWFAYHSVSRDV